MKGVDELEIYDKQDKGYIEVWLTHEEQEKFDRTELSKLLLVDKPPKCKIAFFLSGEGELLSNTENLLLMNLGCA